MLSLPNTWFARFAIVIPFPIVHTLMSVCKPFRKHITHNTVWLKNCEPLAAFKDLTRTEKTTIQPELFWYKWYLLNCERHIPICDFNTIREKGTVRYSARAGCLISADNLVKQSIVVVVRVISQSQIVVCSILRRRGRVVTFIKSDEYVVKVRESGSFSIPGRFASLRELGW